VFRTRKQCRHLHQAGLCQLIAATKLGFVSVTAHAVGGTQEAPSNDEGAIGLMEIANPESVVILGTNTISRPRKSKKAAMQHTHDLLQPPEVHIKVDCVDKHA
jgi:hypothetical protein